MLLLAVAVHKLLMLLVLGSEFVFTGLSVSIIHIIKLLFQGTYAGQFVMEVSPLNR